MFFPLLLSSYGVVVDAQQGPLGVVHQQPQAGRLLRRGGDPVHRRQVHEPRHPRRVLPGQQQDLQRVLEQGSQPRDQIQNLPPCLRRHATEGNFRSNTSFCDTILNSQRLQVCEDGNCPVFASCVTISNPDSISSSETGVNPGMRSL